MLNQWSDPPCAASRDDHDVPLALADRIRASKSGVSYAGTSTARPVICPAFSLA
jgi:hypothetical protein